MTADTPGGHQLSSSTVEQFLDSVSARRPAPGGGAVAGVTVAAAAALVAMAARFSADHAQLAEEAESLRDRARELAEEDVRAYGAVHDAYRASQDEEDRRRRIASALAVATDVPLAIVLCAGQVGALAVRLAGEGNPNLHGEAVTAALLAEAAARSAAVLVRLNVEAGAPAEDRLERSQECLGQLAGAVATVGATR